MIASYFFVLLYRLVANKKERNLYSITLFCEWLMGFEPTTSGTTIRRSNQLNYSHHVFASAKVKNYLILNKYKH